MVALFFFFLVFLFKLPIINMPFHWDDSGAIKAFDALLLSASSHYSVQQQHPPFFFCLLASVWSIFGYSIWISHLVVIMFSFVGVYFTYLLGAELKDRKTGFIAALFLFFSPLYFAQSGTKNLDLPLTSLMVATLYFFLKRNTRAYIFFGICTVLTKVYGVLLIFSILMQEVFEGSKRTAIPILKKIFTHGSILIVFIIWAGYLYYRTKWFLLAPFNYLRPLDITTTMLAICHIMKELFFLKYHFILTIFIIAVVLLRKPRMGIYISVFLIIIYFVFGTFFPHTIMVYVRPIIYSIIFITVAIRMVGKNANYLPIFLSMFLIILLLSAFEAIRCFLPRYLLIAYPFFFIISAACLVDIGKKNNFLNGAFAAFFIFLSISGWYGHRSMVGGYELESNLEYLDQIKTHMSACKFIVSHYPNSVVLTSWPQTVELSEPAFGYVTSPVFSLDFRWDDARDYNYQKVDLIYYSDQSADAAEMKEFMSRFNLTLLQSYECNGKTAAVYKVIKN